MTEQEAIKVLEEKGKHIEMIKIDGKDTLCYRAILVEAFEVAIKALEEMAKIKAMGDCYIIPKNGVWEVNGIDIHKAIEKQIAKKPIRKNGECYSYAKDGTKLYEIITECPTCHSIALKYSYPCRCGQVLNWE